jgi:hypothetical protein
MKKKKNQDDSLTITSMIVPEDEGAFIQHKVSSAKTPKASKKGDPDISSLKRFPIGTGPLSWARNERISDRYGYVFLNENNSFSQFIDDALTSLATIKNLVGSKGYLLAVVNTPRKSTHTGDLTHNIFPSTPKKGDEILLNEVPGTLVHETHADGYEQIGIRPDDGRKDFWLNPHKLYRVHEQTVNLYFVEV